MENNYLFLEILLDQVSEIKIFSLPFTKYYYFAVYVILEDGYIECQCSKLAESWRIGYANLCVRYSLVKVAYSSINHCYVADKKVLVPASRLLTAQSTIIKRKNS